MGMCSTARGREAIQQVFGLDKCQDLSRYIVLYQDWP